MKCSTRFAIGKDESSWHVASNLQRVQQVLNAADRSGRKVVLTGQDFERIIRTAMKLKITIAKRRSISETKRNEKYAPEQLLILETGRMGEPIKSLQNG